MTRYKVTKEMWRKVDCCDNIKVITKYYVKESVFYFLWGYVWDCNRRPIEFDSKEDAEKFLIKYRDAYVATGEGGEE